MADTNTPNIGLLLPDLNDTFNFAAHVEANFSTIDGLMGAVQCTTTTRPSNTYAGQIIYESDSKRYVQNTGTKASPVWTYMSHAAMAVTSSTHPTSGLSVGEMIYETDTTRLQVYNGSSFEQKAFARFVCTSSTHPASPFTGMEILETDTNNELVWDGSGWRNIQTGAWTTYSPVWSGTGNSVGNGVLMGSYSKTGRTVRVRIGLYGGSTTNWGSNGTYSFTLPFAASVPGSVPTADLIHTGSITGFNMGNSTFYALNAFIRQSDPTLVYGVPNASANFWGQGTPTSISGTSHWVLNITYESAS